jgi:hypothetical protein
MNYSLTLLATKPDCQSLIDIAVSEKESLAYRKTGLDRQRQNVSLTSVEIETELASVNAELAALQTVVDNLPDGPTKQDILVKVRKAEYKKFQLEQRKGNYGVLSVLEKEYDISCIEKNIDETDLFIQAVTTHMNSLP